jgi:hypothetical protein
MIGNTSISPTADWKKFGAIEKKTKIFAAALSQLSEENTQHNSNA